MNFNDLPEKKLLNIHYSEKFFNPLPVLFKSLLHGQKYWAFFSVHLIYIPKQERFTMFRPAGGV
jgi:hypothetical protein